MNAQMGRHMAPQKSKLLMLLLALVLTSAGALSGGALFSAASATAGGGNEDCPAGTTLLTKYNWNGSAYVAEIGGDIVTVNGDARGGTFSVADGYGVEAMIVKGGTDATVVRYDSPATAGSFSNSDLENNGGQTPAISNLKFCGSEPPTDACPELSGNQPMGTDCTQPKDDRETRDLPGVVNCDMDTYTVEHQERTREYSWDGDSWEPGEWSEWTTYDTTVTPATDEQCPEEPPTDACPELSGNQPMGTDCTQPKDDRETRDLPGVVNCDMDTYTVEHQERTREYSWDGDSWEPGEWSEWKTYDTTVTPATDEQCPPPPADDNDGLCHATGSATNPYVLIDNISSAGIYNGHYGDGRGDHQNGEDIIPPFTYQGQTYSQDWDAEGQAIYNDGCKVEDEEEPEGELKVSSDCEQITFSAKGVMPEDGDVVFKLDGETKSAGTYDVAPGQHTVELFVNGTKVDSETVTVDECEVPPELIVTVIPNQGSCEARTPMAQVTTSFASSIGYRLSGGETVFVHREVSAGTYTVTLPNVAEGDSVSYDIVVVPLDDSADTIVKGPFTFSVPEDCDEVPPCTEFQDESPGMPCYVEREPDVRTESDQRESCKLGGVETTHAVYTTSYSFNEEAQQWESSETATSSLSFEPYTAAELKEKGCVKHPDNPHNPGNPDNPTTPTSNTPTTADTGLWSEEPTAKNGPVLWGMAALLALMGLGLFGYGARRRGQEG